MFWPEEERRRLLQGTGVPEAVEKDLANIRSEYYSIVLPFMDAHADLFSPRVRSLELYRQLVALVMAYRLVFGWWPFSPFLKAMRSSTLTGKWLTGN